MTAAAEIPRLRRHLSTSAWLLALTIGLLGFGFVASRPAAPPERPLTGGALDAERAINALINPGPQPHALALLPKDFTQVTGIVPAAEPARDGTVRAVHADGGCSAPWGDDNTRWDYGVPCKAHDLGYDLLRYAEKIGQPLPASARAALDARLTADMRATCEINPMDSPHACRVVAWLYSLGLQVNSWHQRWGPPVGDPIGPLLAGVAAIGCLLVFRLRGWLRARRSGEARPRAVTTAGAEPACVTLGVASLVLLILGESVLALARWAGADDAWLWPFTWLAQLTPVFFFAGGRANAAGWREVREAGSGYRQYLAHRASWLLRPALVFVVVAVIVPMALELLGIPDGTNAAVVRIALHPLWLLAVYLLTVVATPLMLTLHRYAARTTLVALLALVGLSEFAAGRTGSPVPDYLAVFGLALLAQQVAFGRVPGRRTLVAGVLAGLTGLALLCTVGGADKNLLGLPTAPHALATQVLPLVLLGTVQLCVLGLAARPLSALAARPALGSAVRFALRAPMSLYLGFLAAMLLVVELVYLPPHPLAALTWLYQPRTLTALGLLAVPALIVFWWFERHADGYAPAHLSRPDSWLAHAATALGVGFAAIGLFGFALTSFDEGMDVVLLGMRVDPVRNLTYLLLGVFLLHTARIGTSSATSTWLVAGLACVPPLLEANDDHGANTVTMVVHGLAAGFALIAAASTLLTQKTPRPVETGNT